jgi:hypothetical protein
MFSSSSSHSLTRVEREQKISQEIKFEGRLFSSNSDPSDYLEYLVIVLHRTAITFFCPIVVQKFLLQHAPLLALTAILYFYSTSNLLWVGVCNSQTQRFVKSAYVYVCN